MRGLLTSLACVAIAGCGADVASTDGEGTTGDTTGSATGGETTGAGQCAAAPDFSGDSTEEGGKFGDFTLGDCEKEPVTISERACGKKLVLMEFGAGWCEPCREAQPHFKEIADKYPACVSVFTVLRENQGPNDPATSSLCRDWRDNCAGEGCGVLPFDVLIDPLNKEAGKWLAGGGSFPVTLLVDATDGTILVKSIGAEDADFDSVIEAVCGG